MNLFANLPEEYSYYLLSDDDDTKTYMFRVKQIVDDKSAQLWLQRFSRCTNTTWRISRTYPYSHKINLYKRDYRCAHNTDRRAKGIKPTRHTGCRAALRISVKRYVKRSRAAVPDTMAKDFPGVVVVKNLHNHGDILHAGKDFPCTFCPKKFSTLGCSTRHMNQAHGTSIIPSTNLRCIDCKNCSCFPSVKSFRRHLSEKHDYSIEEEQLCFASMKEFIFWKKDMEERTNSLYVKQKRAKTSFPLKREFYRCHRSAPFYYKDPRKSFRSNNDFKKLGFYCPSSITIVDYETDIKVRFIKQHYMHANDQQHSKLSEEEKNAISVRLQAAAALTEISNDYYDNGMMDIITKVCKTSEKNYDNHDSSIDMVDNSSPMYEDSDRENESNEIDKMDCENRDNSNSNTSEPFPQYEVEECHSKSESNQNDNNNHATLSLVESVYNICDNISNSKTETCFNEVLKKLGELTNVLKENKDYYKENVLQEILRKINHLLAISNLDKLSRTQNERNHLPPGITNSYTLANAQNIITVLPLFRNNIAGIQKTSFIKIAPKPEPRKLITTPQIVYISNTLNNK